MQPPVASARIELPRGVSPEGPPLSAQAASTNSPRMLKCRIEAPSQSGRVLTPSKGSDVLVVGLVLN